MKKRNAFLQILAALAVLSSILLSSVLGVTKSEYFKRLSKTLDFEVKPDLTLEYYLYDANEEGQTSGNQEKSTYYAKNGVYKNGQNIFQYIAVGTKDGKTNTNWYYKNTSGTKVCPTYYFGDSIVYQIKIPVNEAGYYTLDFTVDFLFGPSEDPYTINAVYGFNEKGHNTYRYEPPDDAYFEDSVFTQSYQYCMGCEVLNADDEIKFGENKPLNMANRISQSNTQKNNSDERVYYADKGTHSVYQWKTLTPTRAETVKLSFKATDADVNNGYVVWAWDFTGIKGQHNYRISLTGIDVNKVMNLDGTTAYRSNLDPYFMFPQTSFTNNQVYYNETQLSNANKTKPYYRGSNVPGKTGYSQGRGTFITEATENSLGLRAESLYRSVTVPTSGNDFFTNRADANQSNPVALQIPVKNIKYDTTYKVTFDFSLARQGNTAVTNETLNNTGFSTMFKRTDAGETFGKNLYDYAAFEEIFPPLTSDTEFRSYLYATSAPDYYQDGFGITNENHKERRNQIVYANKDWNNATLGGRSGDFSLTNYNYVTRYNMGQSLNLTSFPNYTTIKEDGTVNDPFCSTVKDTTVTDVNGVTLEMTATTCRNWFNAVQHVEQNGQQGINWITFYNTTFSFNIGEADNIAKLGAANANGFINNLYWVWQIDALAHMGWYNIRIDNVRIQEVVQYSSEIEENGVKIGDTTIGTAHLKYYGQDLANFHSGNGDPKVFGNYRGWNGTGQNCNPRGYDKGNYFSTGNIYAPVIDAKTFSVAPNEGKGENDYKIYLDGWTVCDGGIIKYVYSADGGKTWHDMIFTGTNKMTDRTVDGKTISGWVYAENGVEQRTNQQNIDYNSNSNYVTFDASDGANCNFDGYKLCADLTPYKNQPDLNIIIAAVPATNANARCEILRIMNYNSSSYYASQIESISSDIVTSAGNISIPQTKLAITSGTNGNGSAGSWATNKVYYTEGNWFVDYYPTSGRGVINHLKSISSPIRYDKVAAMASDIPVKKALTISGYVVCLSGVYGYAYSVDGGKTWIDIELTEATKSKMQYVSGTDYNSSNTLDNIDSATKYEKHLFQWITRNFSSDGSYFAVKNYGKFDTADTALKIDLSAYEGQVVDVIVAAKPHRQGSQGTKTGVYLPITKIDNVAVYGEDGLFYSNVYSLYFDRPTSNLTKASVEATQISPTTKHAAFGNPYLNGLSNFSLGYHETAYTIFEPQNVNPINSRFYNNSVNAIQSGGRVTLNGYVVCDGGVARYKYSLDGGETWTVIYDTGTKVSEGRFGSTLMEYARKTNSAFTDDDGANGHFYTSHTENATNVTTEAFFEHAIEFNLPALPNGTERNLLVVAESNKDKLIPVLHIKLKFKYADGNTMQYGYYHSMDREEVSQTKSGIINDAQTWDFYPLGGVYEDGSNHLYNRVTIPVTQAGKQLLTFDFRLGNEPSTDSVTGRTLYRDKDATSNAGKPFTDRTGNITLTANKTHYLEDEKISVDFTCESKGDPGAFGEVQIAIVSEDWKNQNGRQHAIYAQTFALTTANYTDYKSTLGTWKVRIDDITKLATGDIKPSSTKIHTNSGLPEVVQNLRAGRYSIVLIHRDEPVAEVLYGTSEWDDKYLLAKTTIYIHEESEEVNFSIVHDEGEYTYFADRSRQYSIDDPNVDHVYTVTNPYACDDMRGIAAMVDVTEADVKRGYVILDCDYSKLLYAQKHPHEDCEAIINALAQNGETKVTFDGKDAKGDPNGEIFHTANRCVSPDRYKSGDPNGSYFIKQYSAYNPDGMMYYSTTLKFNSTTLIPQPANNAISIPFAGSSTGYGTTTMKIPVSEAGTYDLSFSGYLNNSVTHRGYAKSGTSGWKDPNGTIHQLTLDYTGAAMSIPKTVYTVGEDIPVSYYAKGSVAAKSPVKESGNLPWIGMYAHNTSSNPSSKEEIEAGRYYVQPDSSGVKYISTAGIEPGVYQIYLRDNSATLFHGDPLKYWWEYDMVDPITVIITSAENPVTNTAFEYDFLNVPHIDREENTGVSSGKLSLNKNVFYQGDIISITLPTKLSTSINFWFALCPEGSDSYVTWSYGEHTNLKTTGLSGAGEEQKSTTTGSYKIPPGKYTLYLLVGGTVATAHNNGRVYATMDITILPESMKNNVKGATQIHSLELKEGNIVAKPQDVTDPTSILDPFSYYTVNGTFTATQEDVERGYVIFEYDFTGLGSSVDLSFVIDNFTVTKRESS